MREMMIDVNNVLEFAAGILGDGVPRNLAAASAVPFEEEIECFVRKPGLIEPGRSHATDSFLLTDAEDPLIVANGGACVAGGPPEPHGQSASSVASIL
jgi:hypothetical protein